MNFNFLKYKTIFYIKFQKALIVQLFIFNNTSVTIETC